MCIRDRAYPGLEREMVLPAKRKFCKTEKGESVAGFSKIVVTLSEEISLKIFYMGFIPGFPRIIENLG